MWFSERQITSKKKGEEKMNQLSKARIKRGTKTSGKTGRSGDH